MVHSTFKGGVTGKNEKGVWALRDIGSTYEHVFEINLSTLSKSEGQNPATIMQTVSVR